MLKYHSTYIGFREIPDEISLCINLTNCPNNCKGCHSPWLKEDKGIPLTYTELKRLIDNNKGITCVCFMGEGKEPWEIERLIKALRDDINIKWALYTGSVIDFLFENRVSLALLSYIKLGPYIEEKGPLDNPNTNQRLFDVQDYKNVKDITYKFWKND